MRLWFRSSGQSGAAALASGGAAPVRLAGNPVISPEGFLGDLSVGGLVLREWPSRMLFLSRGGAPERYEVLRQEAAVRLEAGQVRAMQRLWFPLREPVDREQGAADHDRLAQLSTQREWTRAAGSLRALYALETDASAPCHASDGLQAVLELARAGLVAHAQPIPPDDAEAGFGAQRLDAFRCAAGKTLFLIKIKLPRDTLGLDALTELLNREKGTAVQDYTKDPRAAYRGARECLEEFVATLDSVGQHFETSPLPGSRSSADPGPG